MTKYVVDHSMNPETLIALWSSTEWGPTCVADVCPRPSFARGLCRLHLQTYLHKGASEGLMGKPGRMEFINVVLATQTEGCIRWPFSLDSDGYGAMRLEGVQRHAHNAVLRLAAGPPPSPDQSEAAHSCNRRYCVNPRHLRWASGLENKSDQIQHGTRMRGERSHRAKITEAQATEIISMLARGAAHKHIAQSIPTSVSVVHQIAAGRTWNHLPRI